MTWTTEQIRRLVTEGRRFESEPFNAELAHNATVKGIKRLNNLTTWGRDGVGFSGKANGKPRRGRKLSNRERVRFLAARTGKLWGQPLRDARALCVRHAAQLANVANG